MLTQDEHNALIARGDRSRIKTCAFCDSEIDDGQEYCSDDCQVRHEQENLPKT